MLGNWDIRSEVGPQQQWPLFLQLSVWGEGDACLLLLFHCCGQLGGFRELTGQRDPSEVSASSLTE